MKRRPAGKGLVVITERDMDIFRVLSSGPAPFIQLRLLMERICKRKMSDGVLWTRLSKLKRSGYVASRRYAGREEHGRFSLYSLSPLSVELLVRSGYPAGSVRSALPDELTITREMHITDIVRTIKREGSHLYEYQLTERNIIKKLMQGKKASAYPDLHARLVFESRGNRTVRLFDIKVDSGIEIPAVIVEESRGLPHSILVLTAFDWRIDALRRAFAAFGDRKLQDRVIFGLLPDFTRNGFAGTGWSDVRGEGVRLIGG